MKARKLDRFTLKKENQLSRKPEIFGSVKAYENKELLVRVESGIDQIAKFDKFGIFFGINSTPYQAQHFALQYIKTESLFNQLIHNPLFNDCIDMNEYVEIKIPYTFSDLNEEQRSAVDHIVNKRQNLPPYILYGPPGTGKTKTLVAAIAQIVRSTDGNVLVCVQTNSGCDEITERLMPHLENNEMLRLYAKTHSPKKVNEKLRSYSNIRKSDTHEYFDFPDLKSIYGFRVVICTLCTSSCLARARKDTSWKADHFSFVVIDEACCTCEPLCFVGIAGEYIFLIKIYLIA